MDPLDLVHLRTLVAVADSGGFHRAAAVLRLSQSTVSQHVRRLEHRFQQPLVEKSGRASRFTRAGEAVVAEARRLLAVHDEALQRLEATAGPTIRVGCTEHTAAAMMAEFLRALGESYPDRAVRFTVDRSARLEEGVARGALDIAVVLAGDETGGTEIGPLRLAWYAAPEAVPPTAPRSAGPDSRAPDVDGSPPWLLSAFEEPCGLRRRATEALSAAGRPVVVTAASTSLAGVVAGARAGAGVALLPVGGHPPDGVVVRTDLPDLGSIGLRVVARPGLERGIEQVVCAAGRRCTPRPPQVPPQSQAGAVLDRI